MSTGYKDYPIEQIAKSMKMAADIGALTYQKFTCANCGQRLTISEPNVCYTRGTCDKCGHETDIAKQGCNYLLVREY